MFLGVAAGRFLPLQSVEVEGRKRLSGVAGLRCLLESKIRAEDADVPRRPVSLTLADFTEKAWISPGVSKVSLLERKIVPIMGQESLTCTLKLYLASGTKTVLKNWVSIQ